MYLLYYDIQDDETSHASEDVRKEHNLVLVRPEVLHKVDLGMRGLYPVAFIVFNIIYWSWVKS